MATNGTRSQEAQLDEYVSNAHDATAFDSTTGRPIRPSNEVYDGDI